MQYLNGTVGLILVVLTILQFDNPDRAPWIYAIGAILALCALKRGLTLWTVRVLAVATAAVMFFYFAGFFTMAPRLQADWYWHSAAFDAGGLLVAAFAMIPVLSEYSCRMKGDGLVKDKKTKNFISIIRRLPETRL